MFENFRNTFHHLWADFTFMAKEVYVMMVFFVGFTWPVWVYFFIQYMLT